MRPQSLVLVNTGNGKGKSSAAFGVMSRGWARGWRVAVVQFVKSGQWKTGEQKLADREGRSRRPNRCQPLGHLGGLGGTRERIVERLAVSVEDDGDGSVVSESAT